MSVQKIVDSLSPNERKVIPYLEDSLSDICKKTNLDKVSVLRSLEYLQNKKLIVIKKEKINFIQLGVNGILYNKKGLPERRLLNLLNERRILVFDDAQKATGLKDDELKAAIGSLKKKSIIEIKNGKIFLIANREEVAKKTIEEQFLESLPLDLDSLSEEQKSVLKYLQGRKDILEVKDKTKIAIEITPLGREIMGFNFKKVELIEEITPELLKKESNWKNKKFRRYDITSPVPLVFGGKRHFVNQALDYARKIWTEMGFQEMRGDLVQTSFWNFDALFTAQDHPVREMQDTFFIDNKLEITDKELIDRIKQTHEKGVDGSKGWGYLWNQEEAKKVVLRTHTTCLSAQKLYELSKLPLEKRRGKFFSLGKNFRNETVDWKHGFEFYQTEGIVIDKDVNFRNLLGYLEQFFKKMGFEKVRFRPGYFPYTEPSVEVEVWNSEKNSWVELGGAGIFRPEISVPLLGVKTPILAWGQGFDRIIMDYYQIKDLRELYKNNFSQLRKIKYWVK